MEVITVNEETYWVDDLLRGYRVVMSVSIPSGMYAAIREVVSFERKNQSQVVVRLIKLGLIYRSILDQQKKEKEKLLLDEQASLERAKREESRARKKATRKTSSKKG